MATVAVPSGIRDRRTESSGGEGGRDATARRRNREEGGRKRKTERQGNGRATAR